MTELRDFVEKHNDFLDDLEPIPGHFERFEKKMGKTDSIRSILVPLLAAASVAIIVTGLLFNLKLNYENSITLGDISIEYQEAELYYNNLFMTEYDRFQENVKQTNIRSNIDSELESMEIAYEQLIDDFKTNPYDSRVINALIMHYQTKVDFIKQINNQLDDNMNQNITDNNYESDRI